MREGHSGGLEVVGKHERLENYLWVVSVGIGDDRKWGVRRSNAPMAMCAAHSGASGEGGRRWLDR